MSTLRHVVNSTAHSAVDTRAETIRGFRNMRAWLEARGVGQPDADEWARIAVAAFRNSVLRGRAVADAEAYFFSDAAAARYAEMHHGRPL